jgi:hypothetical protein
LRKRAEKLQHELEESSEERTRLRAVESDLKEEVQNFKTENVKLRKDLHGARGQSAQVKELERQIAQQKSEVRTLQIQRQEHAKEKEALLQRTKVAEQSEREASTKLETAEALTKELQAKVTAGDVKISELERGKASEREKAEKVQEDLKQVKRDALREKSEVEEKHRRQVSYIQVQLDKAHADVAAAKKQILGLEDEIYNEKKRADGLKNTLATAEKARNKAETHNATLMEQTSKLSGELSEQGKQLKDQESKLERAQAALVTEKEAVADARRESEMLRRKNCTFREDFPDKLKRISEMMTGFVAEYNEVVDGNGGLGSLFESQRCGGEGARPAAYGGGWGGFVAQGGTERGQGRDRGGGGSGGGGSSDCCTRGGAGGGSGGRSGVKKTQVFDDQESDWQDSYGMGGRATMDLARAESEREGAASLQQQQQQDKAQEMDPDADSCVIIKVVAEEARPQRKRGRGGEKERAAQLEAASAHHPRLKTEPRGGEKERERPHVDTLVESQNSHSGPRPIEKERAAAAAEARAFKTADLGRRESCPTGGGGGPDGGKSGDGNDTFEGFD